MYIHQTGYTWYILGPGYPWIYHVYPSSIYIVYPRIYMLFLSPPSLYVLGHLYPRCRSAVNSVCTCARKWRPYFAGRAWIQGFQTLVWSLWRARVAIRIITITFTARNWSVPYPWKPWKPWKILVLLLQFGKARNTKKNLENIDVFLRTM